MTEKQFLLFDANGDAFQPVRNFNRKTGASAFRIKPPGASNEADDALEVNSIEDVARAMLVDMRPARIRALSGGTVNYLTFGGKKLVAYELDPEIAARIGVPAMTNRLSSESEADAIRAFVISQFIQPARDANIPEIELTLGQVLKAMSPKPNQPNTRQVLDGRILREKAGILRTEIHDPDDYTQYRQYRFILSGNELGAQVKMPQPTNLILYGPPGTGKTYTTAMEAVKLCDGSADYGEDAEGRAALMKRYDKLVASKRIAFVTFHQNFSYEDFVEGLRPNTQEGSAGFTLEAEDGVFKQIADLAATNRGRALRTLEAVLDHQQNVFKLTLGRSTAPDDTIFESALDGGYVLLGSTEDIDWSDAKYESFPEVRARWMQDHPDASALSGYAEQAFCFRKTMMTGAVIIVADGLLKFRAVAEITGPYEYRPDLNGEYPHRRKVRWLWHNDHSQPIDRIYDKRLSPSSCYQMQSRLMNWDALEQIVASGGDAVETTGTPEPHVLIIDEINRANISKVFGELITLIEPDKRLGMENALKVTLPYSKREFGVPANLHIIGTMNTADRSIALLDTALRRRFTFKEMAPKPDLLKPVSGIDLPKVLKTINDRIEYLLDREHRIGHAFFMGCVNEENTKEEARKNIDAVMRDKVIPLLQEYFFEDWEQIWSVLGDGFIAMREIAPPPGFEGRDKRKSWSVVTKKEDGTPGFPDKAYDWLISGKPKSSARTGAANDANGGEPAEAVGKE